jgi:RimJ/RimL family protein N-acetyltransferase
MFLNAKRIGFRQIEETDLPQLRDWRNLPEIRTRTRESLPLTMMNQKSWWNSLSDNRNIPNIMFGIYKLQSPDKNLIGVCGLVHIDWKNRNGEFSYYLGEDTDRGQGFGREVAYLIFEYGFRELGLHRIWAEVYSNATDILAIDAKLGFVHEGIMRDTYWCDGKWWDSHLMSVLDSEWLELRATYL